MSVKVTRQGSRTTHLEEKGVAADRAFNGNWTANTTNIRHCNRTVNTTDTGCNRTVNTTDTGHCNRTVNTTDTGHCDWMTTRLVAVANSGVNAVSLYFMSSRLAEDNCQSG